MDGCKRLNIMYQNVRGLRTKCIEISNNILLHDYDVILISESWLQGDVLDTEICDNRYDVFRYDRNLVLTGKRSGGGVVCLVRHDFGAECRPEWVNSGSFECVCLTLPARILGTLYNLNIILSYMPPDSNKLPSYLSEYYTNLKSLYDKHPSDYYLLVGDFNIPCLQWNPDGWSRSHLGGTLLQDSACGLAEDLCILGLNQYNFLSNCSGNVLDLCFCNLPLIVNESEPLTNIDRFHPPLLINIMDLYTKPLIEHKISRYNFRNCNYESINSHFNNIDWDHLFLSTDSVDDAVKAFYDELDQCFSSLIPLVYHENKHYPIWYSRSLIKIIRKKGKVHRKWKKYSNPRDYDEFRLLRERQRRVQSQCFDNFIRNAEENIKKSPKYFWKFVKSKKGGSNYPRLFTINGNNYTNGQDICTAFNDFFESVFTISSLPDVVNYSLNDDRNCTDTISEIVISKDMVHKHLSSLDVSKGAGCDGVPPIFLSSCAQSLAYPISLLFQLSLKQSVFPMLWKRANVIPIHKKGPRSGIVNYRPISILNTIAKVFEKIVFHNIYPVLSQSIPDTQHGFMRRRSTVSNLACFTDYVFSEMENGGQVDVVYTDFEKAFDRVDHVNLLHKLQTLGIRGDLLRWVQSYLSNRSQAVIMGGFKSDFIKVPSGVPQGSHLGPLFYNAYIFDIINHIKYSRHILYADDKKIYLRINSLSDCLLLQEDLNSLLNYYTANNITVSISKCQCISFTRKRNPIIFQYNFNGVMVERVKVVRDLGVLLDSDMSMRQHIESITSRAFRNLGFVMRTCQPFSGQLSLKVVYFAYVRCLLEYASQVWCPFYSTHKQSIERIQKKFIGYINFKCKQYHSDYTENCRSYNLLTLDERRYLLDMSFLHDVISGYLDCPELLSSISFNTPKRRTRHTTCSLFHVPIHRTNYGRNGVSTRLAESYNKYFSNVDLFNVSKSSFKKGIVDVLTSRHAKD